MNRFLAVLVIGFFVLLVSGGPRFAIGLTLKPMAADFDWSRGALSAAVLVFLVLRVVLARKRLAQDLLGTLLGSRG